MSRSKRGSPSPFAVSKSENMTVPLPFQKVSRNVNKFATRDFFSSVNGKRHCSCTRGGVSPPTWSNSSPGSYLHTRGSFCSPRLLSGRLFCDCPQVSRRERKNESAAQKTWTFKLSNVGNKQKGRNKSGEIHRTSRFSSARYGSQITPDLFVHAAVDLLHHASSVCWLNSDTGHAFLRGKGTVPAKMWIARCDPASIPPAMVVTAYKNKNGLRDFVTACSPHTSHYPPPRLFPEQRSLSFIGASTR